MSDISIERGQPGGPREAIAGLANLRVWGIKRGALQSAAEIRSSLRASGFTDIEIRSVGDRVFPPVITFMRKRLATSPDAPAIQRWASRVLLDQWELLYSRGMLDYILVTATSP